MSSPTHSEALGGGRRAELDVSEHAAFRWMQRVNVERNAKREIRAAYERAHPVERADVDGYAYHDPQTRVTLVRQENEIVTLWREVDRHGDGGESL